MPIPARTPGCTGRPAPHTDVRAEKRSRALPPVHSGGPVLRFEPIRVSPNRRSPSVQALRRFAPSPSADLSVGAESSVAGDLSRLLGTCSLGQDATVTFRSRPPRQGHPGRTHYPGLSRDQSYAPATMPAAHPVAGPPAWCDGFGNSCLSLPSRVGSLRNLQLKILPGSLSRFAIDRAPRGHANIGNRCTIHLASTEAGSTLTPGPMVEDIAILLT